MKPRLPIFTDISVQKSCVKRGSLRAHPYAPHPRISKAKPAWSLLIACLILLSSLSNAQTVTEGTTIVAVISDRDIAAAADSLGTDEAGKSKGRHFCKIQRSGGLFFACAHLTGYATTDFDAWVVIAKVLSQNTQQAFSDRVAAVETATASSLLTVMQSLYANNTAFYINKVESGGSIMGFMIFGIKDNKPLVAMREMRIFNDVSGKPINVTVAEEKKIDCPGTRCPNPEIMWMGAHDQITTLVAAHKTWLFQELSSVEIARFLVSLQAVTTENVGTPIDLLYIDGSGFKWIQRKPECEEAKNEPAKKPTPKPTRRRRKRS